MVKIVKKIAEWSDVVELNGKYYYCDTAYTFDRGYESMAFECDKNGEVLDWSEVAVNWDTAISHDEFVQNLEDFIKRYGEDWQYE